MAGVQYIRCVCVRVYMFNVLASFASCVIIVVVAVANTIAIYIPLDLHVVIQYEVETKHCGK